MAGFSTASRLSGVSVRFRVRFSFSGAKGATTRGVLTPPKKKMDGSPQLFDEGCDYGYVTDCSSRNWVYHPYFVLYTITANTSRQMTTD